MQMAIDVGGFTAGRGRPAPPGHGLQAQPGADGAAAPALRTTAPAARGVDRRGRPSCIWEKLAAFANYGFPESHSVCFAYLVYASSWLKRYYPAAFCAGLLNAQPMGFYSPHSLVQDARRHGVEVRTPDLNASAATATLEPPTPGGRPAAGPDLEDDGGTPGGAGDVGRGRARRCGWASARCGGSATSWPRQIAAGRPYAVDGGPAPAGCPLIAGPARGAGHRRRLRRASASTGGRRCGRPGRWPSRRRPRGGTARRHRHRRRRPRRCRRMTGAEEARADLWATGVSPEGHPTRFVRAHLDRPRRGHRRRAGRASTAGERVLVGGVVTHRQRPATAGGTPS